MKHIIYIISLIILLGACTDEKYSDTLSSGAGKSGKPVTVELVLNVQSVQSPLSSETKAGGSIVNSTQVCKGMEINMVETPITRAIYEDEIANFWVFQFNGTTPESTLARKQFISGNSVKDVELVDLGATTKSKIIVIANADQSVFNGLTIDGTSLTDFNKKAILYTDNKTNYPLFATNVPTPRVIYAGSTDMIVAANKQADILLYRSVAQVKVNLSLSQEMQNKGYNTWSYQFMQIPDRSFYYSIGRTAGFPGATVGYINYSQQVTTMPATIDNIYLPVNLHNPVPFTTPEMRVTNAPVNATYLQLVGIQATSAGVISNSVVYQIHLGSNFTDNYNISPNYSYTYNIKITGESDDDSRVVKFVAGYFGGSLKMYKKDVETTTPSEADTWRYDKRIEVYVNDVNPVGGVAWVQSGSSMPSSLNDLMNGRQNTLDLNQNIDRYPAAKLCIGLNPTTPVTNENMVWYMPSYGQSLGIYVAGSKTLKSLPNTTYWSSTANPTFAWGTQVWSGQSSQISPTTSYSLRCVKDLEQTNVIP